MKTEIPVMEEWKLENIIFPIRKGFAAENMAVVRHIALNMLKNEKTSKRRIAGKRFNTALDFSI